MSKRASAKSKASSTTARRNQKIHRGAKDFAVRFRNVMRDLSKS